MALAMQHSLSRNVTRDAVMAGNYSNIRIHGMEGNMNPFQQWATLRDAQTSLPSPRTEIAAAAASKAGAALSSWRVSNPSDCKPGCVPGANCSSDCSALMAFSATCYYFAESLADGLAEAQAAAAADATATTATTPTPIGVVHTAWGGSSIEQWLTNETIETCE